MTLETEQQPIFRGFRSPNYTSVPDELFDELLPRLSGAELKVLLYIIRRTFGFKKDSDNISLSQMLNGLQTREGRVLDQGVGLTKKTLLQALRTLEDQNIILSQRRQSAERGNEPTNYRLHVAGELGGEITPPLGEKLPQGGGGEIPPSPWGKNSPIQETDGQETDQQHGVVIADALTREVGAPPVMDAGEEAKGAGTDVLDSADQGEESARLTVATLVAFGISQRVAQQLGRQYPEDYLLTKLDLAQHLVATKNRLVDKNPAGYLRRAIEEDYLPPPDYKSPAQRQAEERARSAREQQTMAARRRIEEEVSAVRVASRQTLHAQYPPTPIPGTQLTTARAWTRALALLKKDISNLYYTMWVKDALLLSLKEGVATIGTPNALAPQYLAGNLKPRVEKALHEALGQGNIRIQVVVVSAAGAGSPLSS